MANQYTLTNDFAEIAEEKGTLYNNGDSAIELASTADTEKGAGILLLTGERRTFSGTLYARSMDAAGLLNVADFNDGGEGGEDNLSGVPIGTILPYSANANTPTPGFLYCEGQAISRTMYPDLFALIGTTYGAGDGSTTFNLPNLIGKYPQGETTAGTVKSAGLPNIEGSISPAIPTSSNFSTSSRLHIVDSSGAFSSSDPSVGGNYFNLAGSTTVPTSNGIRLDASRSSAIYGNSDTVTPPTLTVRWIIKAYDAPTPSSAQIDLSQYASDLAARLTREQTPAFNKRDVITTSGTYTAPVTGWYRITVKGGGGGGAGGNHSGTTWAQGGFGGGEGGTSIGLEKLSAGDTVTIVIGAGGTGGAAGGGTGGSGGNSTATVNGNTYTGGGAVQMTGGTGDIVGASGGTRISVNGTYINNSILGGVGGGTGGGSGLSGTGTEGGGGGGGYVSTGGVANAGGAGGNGYCWIEYFDPTLM